MSVAVVTGGSRGIGRAVTECLRSTGWQVAVLARESPALREVASEQGGGVMGVACDVTDQTSVTRAVDRAEGELGPVDLLVDNAGASDPDSGVPWAADPHDWWQVLATNVRGPYLMAHTLVPRMLERGSGRIFETASGMGVRATPAFAAYSVSKAAQLRWVDNLAVALADSPVRVLAVSPGLVKTDMTRQMFPDRPDEAFGPVEPFCAVVQRFAAGELDDLHGWFVHVRDDLDALLAAVVEAPEEARRLRLRPYGPDDPQA